MSYDAIVTNPNGAKIYNIIDEAEEPDEYDAKFKQINTIPYNKKIKITEEVYDLFNDNDDENNFRLDSSLGDLTKITFATGDFEGYININDIKPLETNYNVKESDFINEEELYILKDLNIKNAPSEAFETIGTLKKGEKVKLKEFLISSYAESCMDFEEEDEEESGNKLYKCASYWSYVEYNNIKGYVNTYEAIASEDKNEYLLKSSIDLLYIEQNGTNKFIFPYEEDEYEDDKSYKLISKHTIPVNTLIKDNIFSYPQSKFYIVYLVNNDELIEIPSYQLASRKDKIKITALKDLKVYNESSQTDKKDRKAITTIKKGESFVTSYYDIVDGNTIFIYYEKDNIKGWIEVEDDDFEGFEYLDKKSNVGKISNKVSYCYIGKKDCKLPSNYKEQTGEAFNEIKVKKTNTTPNEQQINNNNNTDKTNETINNTKQLINNNALIKYIPIVVGIIFIIIIICIILKGKRKKETN